MGKNYTTYKRKYIFQIILKTMKETVYNTKTGMARAEYIEVEPNVRLHVTDAGEGRTIVLIPGWPLSDEMYEYQNNQQISKNLPGIENNMIGVIVSDSIKRPTY